MIQKVLVLSKDPNIQMAFVAGIVVPKIARFLYSSAHQLLYRHKVTKSIYVGIELGGTNYNIAVGVPTLDKTGKIIDFHLTKRDSGRTSNDAFHTLQEITDKVLNCIEKGAKIHFIGISCFGPLGLQKDKPDYGHITSTPKEGWKNTPVVEFLRARIQCDNISIETDVNAAAFA